MLLNITKEWITKMAELENGMEISAGSNVTRVRHVKRGTEYTVVGTAAIQTDTPLTDMVEVVVYQADDGKLWVRPVSEFKDGRFVPA